MGRMILSELSGTRVEPEPSDVLRTVGNPEDGTCVLAGGEVVYF
jgi:hypothetical protein